MDTRCVRTSKSRVEQSVRPRAPGMLAAGESVSFGTLSALRCVQALPDAGRTTISRRLFGFTEIFGRPHVRLRIQRIRRVGL